jgi:hypothetical protein
MVDVKGGYWETFSSSTLTLISGHNPLKRRIARLFNSAGLKGYRELGLTLDGVAPGQAALETHKAVSAREPLTTGEVGGVRTIDTITDVNRVSAAADVTDINGRIFAFPVKPTYVANGDRNPRNVPGGVGS